jgi:hypothetical protein
MTPKNRVEEWIQRLVPGRSFVDIGGCGVGSINERVTFAAAAGASSVTMADITDTDFWEWDIFRKKAREASVSGIREIGRADIRDRESLKRIGRIDLVHATGIFYHLPSPPDALWSLRSIVGEYLITNTVTFPGYVENEYGSLRLPDCGVLFLAAMSEKDRKILGKYYGDKFGMDVDGMSPRLDNPSSPNQWVENGELTCWPNWWFYSDNAFRALLRLCRLEILDEFKWEDHTLQVLCRPIDQ